METGIGDWTEPHWTGPKKNPFYELEMPIRCELFTLYLEELIERHSNAGGGGTPGGGSGKKTAGQY